MRICMVLSTPIPPREGIGFYVWNLSRYLIDQGHEVQILTRGQGKRPYCQMIEGIPVWFSFYLPLFPLHVHVQSLALRQLLGRLAQTVDLFHVHSPLSPIVATGCPTLLTVHSAVREDVRQTRVNNFYSGLMKLQSPFSFQIEQQWLRRADRVTAVSHQVATNLQTYSAAPAQIRVTWNGVDIDQFFPLSQEASLPPFILSVGRLAPGKGWEDLLTAVALLHSSLGQITIKIVGDGPQRSMLEKQIKQLGLEARVELVGHVSSRDALAALYRQALLYIMPSHHEGLPTVVLEAMASGCAVLSTDVGGIPEVITSGKNGLLVPPREPRQMAEAIEQLVCNQLLRESLGHSARETVTDRFSWSAIGNEYERLYQEVLS